MVTDVVVALIYVNSVGAVGSVVIEREDDDPDVTPKLVAVKEIA